MARRVPARGGGQGRGRCLLPIRWELHRLRLLGELDWDGRIPPHPWGTPSLGDPHPWVSLIAPHRGTAMDGHALEGMMPYHHPFMENQDPVSQPHTPLRRPGISPASPRNAPQDPAPAPLRLTAAPALQVSPGPPVWGCEDPWPGLGVREEPCLALQPHCFPFSQKSAISGDARTRTEPGSAWMGTTAPPVSARWVPDVPKAGRSPGMRIPRDEHPQG